MSDLLGLDPSEIGHNESITRNGKTFHIQTEVSSTTALRIVTTIFQGGTILESIKNDIQHSFQNEPFQITKLAKIQHQNAVKKIMDGKYA